MGEGGFSSFWDISFSIESLIDSIFEPIPHGFVAAIYGFAETLLA